MRCCRQCSQLMHVWLPQAVERTRITVQLRRLASATSASPCTHGPAGGRLYASGSCAGAAEDAEQCGAAGVCQPVQLVNQCVHWQALPWFCC